MTEKEVLKELWLGGNLIYCGTPYISKNDGYEDNIHVPIDAAIATNIIKEGYAVALKPRIEPFDYTLSDKGCEFLGVPTTKELGKVEVKNESNL